MASETLTVELPELLVEQVVSQLEGITTEVHVLTVEGQELLIETVVEQEVIEVTGTELLQTTELDVHVLETGESELLEVAAQGPPGPQGIQGDIGPPGETTLTLTASAAIGGHRAVILNPSGQAMYADNTDLLHVGRVAGLTLNAALPGTELVVVDNIMVTEPGWSWTPYAPIYLSTLGQITQTPPMSGFLQVIGIALSATSAFIRLREPIVIN